MKTDIKARAEEIKGFFQTNACSAEYDKYNKYFKGDFDGYGIKQKVFEKKRDEWINNWTMSLDEYLALGDHIFQEGKFEEKSLIIHLLQSKAEELTKETFHRIDSWFSEGINNWALCDVFCMLLLHLFIQKDIVTMEEFRLWCQSESEWQRRSVPVTLNVLIKKSIDPEAALKTIAPLMPDTSEFVQKGTGTFLRSLWKKYPELVEDFLLQWKDQCARKIIQYATEKMDKEKKKRFKKEKKG